MGRQRNIPQIKEQEKSSENKLNKMDARNITHIEFKTMDIKMLKKLSEYFNSLKNIWKP